jgi:hypothetical protein
VAMLEIMGKKDFPTTKWSWILIHLCCNGPEVGITSFDVFFCLADV